MKIFRGLIIGFMIGGALASKSAIYISTLMSSSTSTDVLEFSLIAGSIIGMMISLLLTVPFSSNEDQVNELVVRTKSNKNLLK